MRMNIEQKTQWMISPKWIIVSLVVIVVALAGIFVKGLQQDIDFAGGARAQVIASCDASQTNLQQVLGESAIIKTTQQDANCIFDVETTESRPSLDEEITGALSTEAVNAELVSFEQVGPSLGAQLKAKALWALLIVALAIIGYVAYAFTPSTDEEAEKAKAVSPIPAWLYGVVAVIALIHDIIIPAGLYAWLGLSVNTQFVIGVLAILGLSVNDTIVVFDRIRENIQVHAKELKKKTMTLQEVAHVSVKQTVWRSLHTSLTLIVVLAALLILGPDSTKPLATMLLAGTIVGTYSSIFFGTPLLVAMVNKRMKKK